MRKLLAAMMFAPALAWTHPGTMPHEQHPPGTHPDFRSCTWHSSLVWHIARMRDRGYTEKEFRDHFDEILPDLPVDVYDREVANLYNIFHSVLDPDALARREYTECQSLAV
jgi:hypothetical protein